MPAAKLSVRLRHLGAFILAVQELRRRPSIVVDRQAFRHHVVRLSAMFTPKLDAAPTVRLGSSRASRF